MKRRTLEERRSRGRTFTAEAVTKVITIFAHVGPNRVVPREVALSLPRIRALETTPDWSALDARIASRLQALRHQGSAA